MQKSVKDSQFLLEMMTQTRKRTLPLLLSVLYRVGAQRGHSVSQIAMYLGVTPGYFAQLQFGIKGVENISRDFADAVAQYLKIPVVLVFILSGKLQARDFMLPNFDFVSELDVFSDGGLNALMPDDMVNANINVQSYVVTLLQESQQKFRENSRNYAVVLHELMRAALLFESWQTEDKC